MTCQFFNTYVPELYGKFYCSFYTPEKLLPTAVLAEGSSYWIYMLFEKCNVICQIKASKCTWIHTQQLALKCSFCHFSRFSSLITASIYHSNATVILWLWSLSNIQKVADTFFPFTWVLLHFFKKKITGASHHHFSSHLK